MTYGWNQRREFQAYLWRRLRAHGQFTAAQASQALLAERTMENEMARKNASVNRINAGKKP